MSDSGRSVRPVDRPSLRVRLGAFATQAATEEAARQGLPLSRVLEHAALSYVSAAGSDRFARRLGGLPRPRLHAGQDSEALVVELELDAGPRAALEEEAGREASSVEQVLHHAILLYLADLDSGRVTARLLEPLEDEYV